jgi:hypothetical protein
MRIALVAPLIESVPPKLYGGTERVVHWLSDALLDLGHDVTVFASGDSEIRARLVPCCERSLRLSGGGATRELAAYVLQMEAVAEASGDFDIIHFHNELFQFPVLPRLRVPSVCTLHGVRGGALCFHVRFPAPAVARSTMGRDHPSRNAARPHPI